MTRKERATKLTTEARELNLVIGRSSLALAPIYQEVIDEELWKEFYKSLDDWLEAVGDVKRSQAQAAAKIYRDLSETIPKEAIQQMTMANARDMVTMPVSKRTADVVQAAATMTNKEYRKVQEAVAPGSLREETEFKGFKLERSALEMVEKALALCKDREGLETDAAAAEFIFAEYLTSEGEAKFTRSARAVVEKAEELAADDSAPAEYEEFLSPLLTLIRSMGRAFGFPERRALAKKPPAEKRATPATNRLQ